MSIELISFQPHLRDQVAQLQTHLWGADLARNLAYLEWKYEQNPWSRAPLIKLAADGGRVVGMVGAYTNVWEVGEYRRRLRVANLADAAVEPEYRRQGVFTSLLRGVIEAVETEPFDCWLSTSAGEISRHTQGGLGHRKLFPLTELKADTSQETTAGNGAEPAVPPGDEPASGEMAELVARLGTDGRMRLCRDRDFYGWRYRNPLNRYRFFYHRDGGLRGFLVVQQWISGQGPTTEWHLVDWAADSEEVFHGLLRTARQSVPAGKLIAWQSGAGGPYPAGLAEAGFEEDSLRLSKAGFFTAAPAEARTISEELLGGLDPGEISNWDIRMIASDYY